MQTARQTAQSSGKMEPNPPKPLRQQVLAATETYLRLAYGDALPQAVQKRLDRLHEQPEKLFYDCEIFETERSVGDRRLSLRLGNRLYPHMKLTIDRRPDGRGYLFRADTHDRHIEVAEDSPEHALLRQMREQNQRMAQEIERAWTAQGLPTFKSYLREDLTRRRGKQG